MSFFTAAYQPIRLVLGAAAGAAIGVALGLGLAILGAPAHAAGGGGYSDWSAPAATPTTDLERAKASIAAKDYEGALGHLAKARSAEPRNADVHNLIGFASRKLGRYDQAGPAYETALSIDPKHRGALEYQGELFLTLGQPEKAKANLARLDKICWLGCDEHRDLKKAIAAYEAKAS